MKYIPKEFVTTPIVYAVKDTYQIIVPVSCETVMWVKVGDRCFYDDSNGILRSASSTHKITVPQQLLNKEKKYTVCYRIIYERRPYDTDAGDVMYYESDFRPVENTPVHIYHIADAHNNVGQPVAAGSYFGDKLDLLILNGDIPNHSGDIKYFTAIHEIAARLTNGEIPVVFSRGNHDTRGIFAEKIEEHTPTDSGRSYYTFRLGHIWGIVLDCGEDKCDNDPAYGHTICCSDFRQRQTEYIKSVIANCKSEYEAEGVENRIVVCHVPFTEKFEYPFDIENDTYTEWARLLREHVHPQLMLCGHTHNAYISRVGGEKDDKGQPCTVIVASKTNKKDPEALFYGGAITLYSRCCNVKITSDSGHIMIDENIVFDKE
ncbi:MAG: metallophosphoesterase [Ruminococcaceae bacterium]|nr:metallophosphoesterase [Oscillospiraceae bacterium]